MTERTADTLHLARAGDGPARGTFAAAPPDDRAGGVRLTAGAAGCGSVAGLVAGVAAAAVTTGIAAYIAADIAGGAGWAAYAVVGVGTLLTVCGAGWSVLVNSAAHPAELVIAPYPLRSGDACEVRFAQRLKRGLRLNRLLAEVVCVEKARYDHGSGDDRSTRTDTATRLDRHLPPVDLAAGDDSSAPARQAVTAAWAFEVPPGLPPSLDAGRNDVTWSLTVTLAVDRHPDVVTRVPLEVR